MRTSDSLTKISPDLVAALGEIEGAAKSANNPHFRSKYANLEAVVDASRDVLAKHKLAVMQGAGEVTEGKLHLTTRLLHVSGEWVEEVFSIPLAKNDPQATLAALTYARRGALMAILGMPAVDDDGETAMGRGAHPEANRRDLGPSSVADDFHGSEGQRGKSSYAAKKDGTDKRFNELRAEIADLESPAACGAWAAARKDEILAMPESWRKELRGELDTQRQLVAQPEEMEPAE